MDPLTNRTVLALRLAQAYSDEMEEHRRAIGRLSGLRHEALLEARRQGLSVIEIAKILGVSRQQIHRLLRAQRDEDRT